MTPVIAAKSPTPRALLDLAICGIAFAGAALLMRDSLGPVAFIAIVFWWGVQWTGRWEYPALRPILMGAGLAMIAGAAGAYADWWSVPLAHLLYGCGMASIILLVTGRNPRSWRLVRQVQPETLTPMDLLWSDALRQMRPAMAAQAVYSNLIGLLLLVILWPLIMIAAIAARISAGPGPLFDNIECAGFQGIPFFRRSFRLKHVVTGKPTMIGRWLVRLRVSGLPQLINLVRGEMGLFGPQPVRMIFADYLDGLSPVFSQRLLVKPGIFGWTQAQGRGVRKASDGIRSYLQEEKFKLAYDLYYLEFGSPLLDLEIVGRTLLRPLFAFRHG